MDAHRQGEIPREMAAQATASEKDRLAPSEFSPREVALRFVKQHIGGGIIVGVAVANIILWLLLWPSGQLTSRYLGEIGVSVEYFGVFQGLLGNSCLFHFGVTLEFS